MSVDIPQAHFKGLGALGPGHSYDACPFFLVFTAYNLLALRDLLFARSPHAQFLHSAGGYFLHLLMRADS